MRSRNYQTRGIVLKSTALKEADLLITVCTPRNGKIKAIAKGASKSTSRLVGHLETLNHSHLTLSKSKNIDFITQAEVINSFRNIKKDFRRLTAATNLTDLTNEFMIETSGYSRIFQLLFASLTTLEKPEFNAIISPFFKLRLLTISGFEPNFTSCTICETKNLISCQNFSLKNGGILCNTCATLNQPTIYLKDVILQTINKFQLITKISELINIKISSSDIEECENILNIFTNYQLDKEPNSQKFIRKLKQTGKIYKT